MRKEGTGLARSLRRRETSAETKLWSRLRNRQVDGWKFRRQEPFGAYVLDFLCIDASLAVEVDGGTHSEPIELERDAVRTSFLQDSGLRVLRFKNGDVLNNIDGVVESMYQALGQRPAPAPGETQRSGAPYRRGRPLPEGSDVSEQVDEQAHAQTPHH